MTHFFDISKATFDNHKYAADRVFNMNEIGLSIVQSKVTLRGTKQVGSLTSAERGSLVTAFLCMVQKKVFFRVF